MSEEIIRGLKQEIETAEAQMAELLKMIEIAAKAGEDVTSLKAKYLNVKAKVDRWKKALSSA